MDLKQIFSLHLDGFSNRKIGSTLGISRNTINIYMKLFTSNEYSFIELLHFDNATLSELFSSHTLPLMLSDKMSGCYTLRGQ
ncbi:LuxR C-terminal-related transcriptional regulator [Gillisia sp. Hel_I_29]|uniref:LuxR C-terminal-related transcriptional regulator n=1 Tax=Gillisia sp. Hel_I_29 TaxID=1249975 RepID=UPI003977446E